MAGRNLAVDLGGTRVRAAVADEQANLFGRVVERTDLSAGSDSVIAQIVRMCEESMRRTSCSSSELGMLVVASPGPLDSRLGVVYEPPNMPGWGEVALRDVLADRLAIQTLVLNDANTAALGEFFYGSGKGAGHLVYLTVSTGIGGGVVIDGRLLQGKAGMAGEIGHMTIDRHGPLCKCGNIGCLEMLASGTSIARRMREALAAGESSLVTDWASADQVTADDVARAAEQGDQLAATIFEDAAGAVGNGVVNCIHLFNPDIIALGGGVTRAGHLLFDPIQRMVDRYALPLPRSMARVIPAELGEDVGLKGCAAAAAHPEALA